MKDIKCPSCGKTFRIDPSSFEEILLQIKDEEFNKQLKERLILAEEDNKKALEILKRELKIQLIEQNRIKESEIQTLESKLKIAEEKKTNALNDLKNQATNKINSLNNELIKLKDEIKNQSLISELSLKNKVSEAVTNLEKENTSLTNLIEKMRLEHSINEKLIEEKFKSKISERDLTIQELREMKSRLSTKMVGETLEIHCETQFNLNRSSAFKNSYFEKDNDASSGSKGDYIFREFDENKTEVVSIMFEMKNESLNGNNKRILKMNFTKLFFIGHNSYYISVDNYNSLTIWKGIIISLHKSFFLIILAIRNVITTFINIHYILKAIMITNFSLYY